MRELDLDLDDGRTLHAYDTGPDTGPGAGLDPGLVVLWHHGTPNVGPPPAPLRDVSARLGVRWLGLDRPGYGGSTPRPGRDVAAVADDAARVADAVGVERFAVMGHSGGGPHALACAALLPDRVVAVVSVAGIAPRDAAGLDWYAGMTPSGVDSLHAAEAGREAKLRYETSGVEYDPEFTPADQAALAGPWSWLESVTGPEAGAGLHGLVDDDLAFVAPWGFDPAAVRCPTLLLHGRRDRIVPPAHGEWLAGRCPAAELRVGPDDGHVSILREAEPAVAWLVERVGRRTPELKSVLARRRVPGQTGGMLIDVPEGKDPITYVWGEMVPHIGTAAARFSGAVYEHSSLGLREFEAARLRIAFANGCVFCQDWRTERDGVRVEDGFEEEVRGWRTSTVLTDRERLAAEYAERYAEDHHGLEPGVDPAFWARMFAHYSQPEVVELTMCLGSWLAFGRLNRVLGLDVACVLPSHPQRAT